MAGRKKSKGKGRKTGKKRSGARQSYAGLTRKQLIARLRAAHAGKGTSKRKKGRRKARGLTYSQKVKYGLVTPIPKGHLEKAHGSDLYRYNDPGRRKKKGGKKKGKKKALSAWVRFIKANKNRRGMRKKNGQLNLRALAVAYRKSPAGKKSKKSTARKSPKRGGKKRGKAKKRSSRRDYGWY